tara:strand:- start:1057 stop:1986 length:930 start_codon:yes stop_codon:yes gene_type:complete
MKCKICSKNSIYEKVNSYKYVWYFCKSCKNIFSINKKLRLNSYTKLLIKFLSKITKQKRIEKLLLYNDYSNQNFYDYYNYVLENNKNSKWVDYDNKFIKYLDDNKILIKNKSILSISDEPGFIADYFKKYTNDITFTALDKNVAKNMADKLNINVKKYDLNKDKISEICNRKFDLIFFRSTLNFNLNFEDLINEIKKISSENTIIVFNFHSVSISSCLMWMFDDYSLKSLINLEYIKLLIKDKFLILNEYKIIFNPRKYYYNTFSKKIFYYPFYLYYLFLYKFQSFFNNNELKFNSQEESYRLILKNIK